MENYYVGLETRSHAFLLERRMKNEGIACEITYMPREIMTDLCNMGVRFKDSVLTEAINLLRYSGLPGLKLYREVTRPEGHYYYEVPL